MRLSEEKETMSLEEILMTLLNEDSEVTYEEALRLEYLAKRKILVEGEIDDTALKKIILPLREMDNDGSGTPIEIILNTPGGDISMSFALISEIEKLKTPTTIRIMGCAMSGGCFIAMAHYNNPNVTTVASKYSFGLLHLGSYYPAENNANLLKNEMKFQEQIEKMMLEYMVTHSKISVKKAKQMLKMEYYMTGQEMFDLGMVSVLE